MIYFQHYFFKPLIYESFHSTIYVCIYTNESLTYKTRFFIYIICDLINHVINKNIYIPQDWNITNQKKFFHLLNFYLKPQIQLVKNIYSTKHDKYYQKTTIFFASAPSIRGVYLLHLIPKCNFTQKPISLLFWEERAMSTNMNQEYL